jgi:hypothetical protein
MKKNYNASACGGVYFFGLVGSAVYFIQKADTFWVGVYGILKAIVWPAIIAYKALAFFGVN